MWSVLPESSGAFGPLLRKTGLRRTRGLRLLLGPGSGKFGHSGLGPGKGTAYSPVINLKFCAAGAEKTVMIHIDEYLIPKGDLHEFPVNGTDEATLQNLLDSAVNKGLMT